MAESDTEKSHDPTPERIRKAREEGQFARSKDAGATAATVAVLGCLLAMGPLMGESLRAFAYQCFAEPSGNAVSSLRVIVAQMAMTLLTVILPTAMVGTISGTLVGFLEAGVHPSWKPLEPKWERLDPIKKLQNIFAPKQMAMSTLLSLLRVVAVGAVAYAVLRAELPTLTSLSRTSMAAAAQGAAEVALRLAFWCVLALVLMAALDYAWSYVRTQQELRMTRDELKDEMKQQEGSPEIKARRRQMARDLVNKSLAKGVRSADVIVVNPTHVSVALKYNPARGAPVVTAKGYDEVALYIRELAKQHDIPLFENITLARTLAAQVRVGKMIPVDLYAAVAEVLAFVYRLKRRGLQA